MKRCVIAIDGPAGTGKSTVAKKVAKQLGYLYIDTGAMYRAVAWKALRGKISFKRTRELVRLARQTKINLLPHRVKVNGQDVTDAIRTEEVSWGAKRVSRIPGVRKILVRQQRRLGRSGGVVMEGRDIGTVVFPRAQFKFFLDASPLERAQRRTRELEGKGKKVSFRTVYQAIRKRDLSDRSRKASPLKMAEDALLIDSTRLQAGQVCRKILQVVRSHERV
ncbi:MAG: (d)CMP kinase [Elusimicrobia bacterium]|nr:(d)CMP kinase [Elusimicrobiota bacterium]